MPPRAQHAAAARRAAGRPAQLVRRAQVLAAGAARRSGRNVMEGLCALEREANADGGDPAPQPRAEPSQASQGAGSETRGAALFLRPRERAPRETTRGARCAVSAPLREQGGEARRERRLLAAGAGGRMGSRGRAGEQRSSRRQQRPVARPALRARFVDSRGSRRRAVSVCPDRSWSRSLGPWSASWCSSAATRRSSPAILACRSAWARSACPTPLGLNSCLGSVSWCTYLSKDARLATRVLAGKV